MFLQKHKFVVNMEIRSQSPAGSYDLFPLITKSGISPFSKSISKVTCKIMHHKSYMQNYASHLHIFLYVEMIAHISYISIYKKVHDELFKVISSIFQYAWAWNLTAG